MSDEEKMNEPSVEVEGVVEEAAAEGTGEGQPSYDEVVLMLEDARAKADDHWNQVLRINAELDNLRKRSSRDLENAHKFALEKFAGELLPVRDSLEMGLAAAENSEGDVEKIREGMELTLKMLSGAMEKFGIVQVDPKGEKFDPQLHEAMSMMESAEAEPNTVLHVVQKGYQLNERLIRPAMVVVAKAGTKPEESPSIDVQA
ncbi:nucleotide exchange factor GrpE [Endothiovibrio diazotrophicus]